MRRRLTNNPTIGRLRISSTTLPTYMLATKPQNSSGWLWISIGPGRMPCTMIAAIITAVTGLVGMPSAIIGTNAPVAAALLADSGPATPSIAPLPKRSGVFEMRRSIPYDTNDEMMCAEPGMMPMRKPSTLPRAMGPAESRNSSREGMRSRSFGRCTSGTVAAPAASRISETPNSPTATGTMPTPSPSSMTPKLKRV